MIFSDITSVLSQRIWASLSTTFGGLELLDCYGSMLFAPISIDTERNTAGNWGFDPYFLRSSIWRCHRGRGRGIGVEGNLFWLFGYSCRLLYPGIVARIHSFPISGSLWQEPHPHLPKPPNFNLIIWVYILNLWANYLTSFWFWRSTLNEYDITL